MFKSRTSKIVTGSLIAVASVIAVAESSQAARRVCSCPRVVGYYEAWREPVVRGAEEAAFATLEWWIRMARNAS